MFGTVQDITDRKRAEHERERLRQLDADLAHVNRVSTLGEMSASLAYEIKQPIAAAITSANSCINGWRTNRPTLIGPVRRQPESISMGIVRLRSSTVYVRSTRNLLHNVSWST
jgi:hypothetical protein